ncbi:MAG TPA: glycine--tRNA ligase subunit beta, partial [Caldimonas sp.]
MTAARNLLVELLVEELPPKSLKALGTAFAQELAKGLLERRFVTGSLVFESFASPRRLGVLVKSVQSQSTPREIPAENFMPVSVAYDKAGKPTPALIKKIKRRYHDAVDVEAVIREKLETVEEGGKQIVKHRAELSSPGSLQVGLEGALEDAI